MDDRRARLWAVAGAVLATVAVALAVLPLDWIEETTGFEPDGGSGALEWLLVLIPLVAAVICLGRAWRFARRAEAVDGRAVLPGSDGG